MPVGYIIGCSAFIIIILIIISRKKPKQKTLNLLIDWPPKKTNPGHGVQTNTPQYHHVRKMDHIPRGLQAFLLGQKLRCYWPRDFQTPPLQMQGGWGPLGGGYELGGYKGAFGSAGGPEQDLTNP
jgi:hypothetical protein